jgi:AcrR family transcriptional regulator
MPANSDHTKQRLILAAEELFALRGIDAVSLRSINQHAEQKNTSAVKYHFGNVSGILSAILELRMSALEAIRKEALDQLHLSGKPITLNDYVDVLARPLAEKVLGTKGGVVDRGWSNYVQVLSQLTSSKGDIYNISRESASSGASTEIFLRIRNELPSLTDTVFRLREQELIRFILISLSDRVSLIRLGKTPPLSTDEYIDNLCCVSAAMLSASRNRLRVDSKPLNLDVVST